MPTIKYFRMPFVILAVVLLNACSTQARKTASEQCLKDGLYIHPTNIEEKLVQKTRSIQVPTGEMNCVTTGYGNMATTNCRANMRTEYIPYTALEKVDLNKRARDAYVKSCADSICLLNHKNKECK
jgi:major membrane immunogen (membrane-anchored lipoprotein)